MELAPPDRIIDPFNVDTDKIPIGFKKNLSDMHNDCEERLDVQWCDMNDSNTSSPFSLINYSTSSLIRTAHS